MRGILLSKQLQNLVKSRGQAIYFCRSLGLGLLQLPNGTLLRSSQLREFNSLVLEGGSQISRCLLATLDQGVKIV